MRPTGFGHKTAKDYTGEYLYPRVLPDGTSLEIKHKTLTEKRRELLFVKKAGLDVNPADTLDNPEATIQEKIGNING